jgi:hypothetical protein
MKIQHLQRCFVVMSFSAPVLKMAKHSMFHATRSNGKSIEGIECRRVNRNEKKPRKEIVSYRLLIFCYGLGITASPEPCCPLTEGKRAP